MPAFRTMRNPRVAGGVRQLVALAAIGMAALGLAQPRVMRLAGLDFAHSPSRARSIAVTPIDMAPIGMAPIDMAPTGTIASPAGDASRIHGLDRHAKGAASPRLSYPR